MSLLQLVGQSLRFHWRTHLAVALGVAAATAVLTGALLIGDSVRGSLRHLVLDRLGQIDDVLILDRFFRQELAAELAQSDALKSSGARAVPAILFPSASVETASQGGHKLASGVLVVGGDDSFWKLNGKSQLVSKPPARGEIIVNAPLAQELSTKVGDTLVLRFGKADQIPADSPLGRRTDRVATLAELKLIEIIPAEGLGRFGLEPNQVAPRNAYVSLADVQQTLDAAGKINTLFVGGLPTAAAGASGARAISKELKPTLADYGISLKHVRLTFGNGEQQAVIYDYFSLASDRLLIDPAAEQVARKAFAGLPAQPVLTYLANSIQKIGDSEHSAIPYSTITAIDPAPGGPLVDEHGRPLPPLAADEIVLTSWAADDQQAKVGDRIRVTYFEPETTHGDEREAAAEFRVKAIVPLTEPKTGFTRRRGPAYDQMPTPANDPDLTPEVKGITDQATIADWDPPFPFDQSRVRSQDDTYWDNHRTTPKAYISLATGQKLWGSRFGNVTSFRIPATEGVTAEGLESRFVDQLKRSGQTLGFEFQPLKAQGLKAAAGTTPFDVLFLLLSMFIIAAALLLVWLLFRLGIDQRADQIGLLLALGWSRPQVRRLFLLEGGFVAALGAAAGVLLGIGYAWLMLVGLRTWWLGAIAVPFLTLHMTPLSLALGFVLGLAVSLLTVWFGLGQLKRAVIRSLLAGEIVVDARRSLRGTGERGGRASPVIGTEYSVLSTQYPSQHDSIPQPSSPTSQTATRPQPSRPYSVWIASALFFVAACLAIYASQLGGEAQAGAFLGAGAALLASLLIFSHRRLRTAGNRSTLLGGGALARLAFRSASRSSGRSTATIALVACSAFLIAAVSAFRMSPTDQGVGGFDLMAESSQPIFGDLNRAADRQDLLADKATVLEGGTVLSLRLKPGDDASCRNLYQPTQPRVLGVTPQMIHYFDDARLAARFAWSASAAKTDDERANPWRLLAEKTDAQAPVPVVLDQNTAMYSLRLYGGVGQTFDVTYSGGPQVTFRVAGLLANSVLQGNLLIGEADFERLFPTISGYRFFLIKPRAGRAAAVTAVLEDRLGDEGFDVTDARQRLADLLAVQNTYISTFQSLGALGLILGTFGVAAVQLRSVFERRKELALLRAAGFRRRRLGALVLLENLVLLVGGLGLGVLAALLVVLPQILLGPARLPLTDLVGLLGLVLVIGIATAMIAVRATLRAPLVSALRGE